VTLPLSTYKQLMAINKNALPPCRLETCNGQDLLQEVFVSNLGRDTDYKDSM
jgi:hypothetical protein